MLDPDPLIVTATLDPCASALLQRLRDAHFPARLNIVPAHLTLFHHLPGAERAAIGATLWEACAGTAPIAFRSAGLRFLGRGVAIGIAAVALAALRERLAAGWHDWLTAQDRQPFRPHVTIQNKAEPSAARALLAALEREGLAVEGSVTGLDLWHYRGGPWEGAGRFGFGAARD